MSTREQRQQRRQEHYEITSQNMPTECTFAAAVPGVRVVVMSHEIHVNGIVYTPNLFRELRAILDLASLAYEHQPPVPPAVEEGS